MAEPTRRRRGHVAASARILTAGLSSAAAFGMVAGMAVSAAAGDQSAAPEAVLSGADAEPVPPTTAPTAPAPAEVVVVVRRHWIPVAADPASPSLTTAPAPAAPPAPVLVTTPASPAPAVTPAPARPVTPPRAARPVTRTRGS